MSRRLFTCFCIFLSCAPLRALTVLAEDPEPVKSSEPSPTRPNKITEVEISGNKIVSTNTILSKIQSQKGAALLQETVNEDIKRLYAMGYFQDIKMEVDEEEGGYRLMISVAEKPVVKQIIFEGFSMIKEEKLRKELKVIEGQILDQRLIKEGVEAIKKLYGDKGFRFVELQSEVDINRETKEATIYIRIVEGEKFKIRSIQFEGNQAFKSRKLGRLMKTKKKRFPLRSGVYKQENFDSDLERIKLFYQQEGYLDAAVSHAFDYDQKEKRMMIKILIDEGKRYVTGDITVEGNKLFPQAEIYEKLEMLPGKTYSQYYLGRDLEKVRDFYEERGYMDARILPDVKLNHESGRVDLAYRIQEGDLYFVEKVVVRGNTKTRDKVIRRELRIRPGERFDGKKIKKSKERLENLNFFEEITYDTEPSQAAPNRKDLVFRVKEKRTGELSFGGGVSSVDNFIGFAEISQRNFDLLNWPRFTGGGQSLAIKARVGSITQDYNVSFVEPYLFNLPVSFGAEVFDTRRDNRNVDFDEERRGFGVTLSRLFKDLFRVGGGYTLERVELDEISEDATSTVRNFEGINWLSRLRQFNTYDSRDNIFNPTRGMVITLSGDLVGSFLGGDQDYYVLQTGLTKYWTVFKKHLIEYKIHYGNAQEFGDSEEVPVFDRFYAGGLGTVRGFNYRRIGPKEAGNAVGGENLTLTNLEYTFPVPRLEAFRFAAFVDAAQIHPEAYKIDFGEFALSVGPGIKIKTPIGPVAFYYGFPIANRDTENRNGRFEFSLSRGF